MKLLKAPVLALAIAVLTAGIAKADTYTHDADLEGWGGTSGNVVTHVFALGAVSSIDSVNIELAHSWASDIDFSLIAPNGDIFDFSSDNGPALLLGDGGSLLVGTSFYEFLESGAVDGDSTGWGDDGGGSYNAEVWHSTGWAAGDWTLVLDDDAGGDDGAVGQINVNYTSAIPEPASAAFLLGLSGLVVLRRRRK